MATPELCERETILLLGGQHKNEGLNSLLMLENNGQNWKELNIKLPYSVDSHGAQLLKSNLYIFGGQNARNRPIKFTYRLLRSLKWKKMADMNHKRKNISNSSVILKNKIWVCGGWNKKEKYLKSVEMYDPETNKWKSMKSMDKCRQNAAAAVVNGKIYCCGGEDEGDFLDSVECYDHFSDVWTLHLNQNMPYFISGHGAVEMYPNLIVFGGWDNENKEHLDEVWTLNATVNNAKWIEKRPPMSISRRSFSIAKINGKVFVCGGESRYKHTDTVEVFDGQGWKFGPKIPTTRLCAAAVAIPMQFGKNIEKSPEEKQTILLVGGDDGGNNDSLLMLDNNEQNWKQLNIKLPYGIHSHGAQFLNNLYIFGGYNTRMNALNCTFKLSKSLQWEKIADMNQTRGDISNSSVVLNNQIWVCGGNDRGTLKSVEMYDPLTNKWKFMKEMNKSRENATAVVVDGKIFCSGYCMLIECYDPSSDVWTPICDLPLYIQAHGAVEFDGNLIVIGGMGDDAVFNHVQALDITNKNSVLIEESPMSIPRYDFSIAKINGEIFVCGGDGAGDNVEIFDGEVWRNGPKMPTIRARAPAVAIPMQFARYAN